MHTGSWGGAHPSGGGEHPAPAAAAGVSHPHRHGPGTPWEATVSWAQIFEHQRQRQPLIEEWLDWLELAPGDHLVDLGAGPGLTSILAARRVQPHGRVIAVDHWPEALAFLRQQVAREGVANVEAVLVDIGRDDELEQQIPPGFARKVVLAHVLHHLSDPQDVLQRLHRWLAPGARMVVAEFDPEGAGRVGPPRQERIAWPTLRDWLAGQGFRLIRHEGYAEQEQYAVLVERP